MRFSPDFGSDLFWVRLSGPGGALSKNWGFVGGSGLQESGLFNFLTEEIMQKDYTKFWTDIAKKQLLNRKIVDVRYLTDEEMEGLGWDEKAIVMILDDGNMIYPSSDDEGNSAGALFTCNSDQPTLPVMRD